MKYYIIAGEASGDLHAANLMKEIKIQDSKAEFRFWGGDLMKEQGGEIVKHYKETAFMGFYDVIKNLGQISKNLKMCKNDILKFNPDVIIHVDYPGFNLRIAEFVHEKGYKVYYYISPKIWAWKQSRVHKIKKFVDKLFIIFPFEIEFYKKFDYQVEFVGNPLLDALSQKSENKISEEIFRKENNLGEKPIIAVLAGSRMSEIKHNLPEMLKVIKYFPDYQFVMAAAPSLDISIYDKFIEGFDIKIVYNKTYDVLMNSKAAIVTSGTATLEAALFNIPELVCYKGDAFSYQIAKRIVKVKYISLVNLIMDKPVIKEFIQYEMTEENIKNELQKLLFDIQYKEKMLCDFDELRVISGGAGASKKTAEIIVNSIKLK
jgi:lipid-A-disaccharide synthase